MTVVTLARTIEPAHSSPRRARRPRGGWWILTLAMLVLALTLLVGLAVLRAIDEPASLGGPSEATASPGVRVVIAEPLDRPVTTIPEPKVVPAPAPPPVTATTPAARVVDAPERTPPKVVRAAARPPEALSSPVDLAEDAAAAGLTGRASPPKTEGRP